MSEDKIIKFPFNSILEAFVKNAARTPDKLFLVEGKKQFSYREALCLAYGYAKYLETKGVKAGDCVVVKTSQTASTILCDMAVQFLDAIYVPLEKIIAVDRVNTIIEKTDAKIFISDKQMEVNAEWLPLQDVLEHMIPFEDIPEITHFPDAEATGEILFTTGTTGTSKGVEMSNVATVRVSENVVNGIGIREDDVEIIPVPINHAFGIRRCYADILCGATIILMDGIVFIDRLWKAIEEYHATGMSLVPASLAVIFKLSGDKISEYKDAIRYIQIGGAVLPASDKNRLCELLPNTKLFDFYGCSEAGCVCTADYNFYKDKRGSMGKPTCNAIFRLIGEDGTITEYPQTGVVGRLAYSGSMVMKGYWREPELTKETIKEGFVITNDLAEFDKDGFIYLLGRQDDVINSAGAKIAPTEIEEIVSKCPGLADCAVVGVPDDIAGEVPKLFVVMEQGAEFDPVTINNFMMDKLEAYKTPKIIVQIEAIPRTYNGKIIRRELKKL